MTSLTLRTLDIRPILTFDPARWSYWLGQRSRTCCRSCTMDWRGLIRSVRITLVPDDDGWSSCQLWATACTPRPLCTYTSVNSWFEALVGLLYSL